VCAAAAFSQSEKEAKFPTCIILGESDPGENPVTTSTSQTIIAPSLGWLDTQLLTSLSLGVLEPFQPFTHRVSVLVVPPQALLA
jgi:hypothetical protein